MEDDLNTRENRAAFETWWRTTKYAGDESRLLNGYLDPSMDAAWLSYLQAWSEGFHDGYAAGGNNAAYSY